MNIKIDDLNIVYENPKLIINNIDNFNFEFDSVKNQLILTRKEVKPKEINFKGFIYSEKDLLVRDNNYNILASKEEYDSVQSLEDDDITIENEEDENDIESDYYKNMKSFFFTNVEKELIKDIKGCELYDVYIGEVRVTTVVWKNLLLYLYGKLTGEELFRRRFINIINGKPNEEQKNKQKYVYCEKLNISIKSSSTQTLMKEILYIVRTKGLKIKLIYKKEGELKEFEN